MSNIYIQEPPTNGKVLLKTTAGDIDIELWSKKAPKACRNFVQLCLEAYYDNTIFHTVVSGFIVQGGDPTGTGTGGESIYGAPFKDEFHSRLRFNWRGLVAMANGGPHDNGSQFFFTLGPADELNNKHTIFGKVTGDTVYNIPRNPHKIKSCEVLFNPFDDIIPREIKKPKKEKPEEEVKKLKPKGTQNFSLFLFGEEAEEEEEENRVSQSMKGKSKSSHDLLTDDPHLSSVPAVESEKGDARRDLDDGAEDEGTEPDEYIDAAEQNPSTGEGETENKSVSRSEELRKEARQLKRELLAAKQTNKKISKCTPDGAIAEYRREKQKYEALRKQQTLALLNQFKSKLTQAIAETPENEISETEIEDDEGWMSHALQFEDKSRKVKDASMQDSDTFEIYDPRNPVNKRRREESKKLMREKKERR
uniref:Spliceosome-associated protein CWC27 homolog n=1 Tax=Cavia porcellus TaxID=10141 RepID=A0A286Y1X4_CAVPO